VEICSEKSNEKYSSGGLRIAPTSPRQRTTSAMFRPIPGLENLGLLKRVFRFLRFLKFFLYEDRTRKYDPKAHEKHPIQGTPYLTKDKSPVSVGEEHHVKNDDEIDKSHQSQLKF